MQLHYASLVAMFEVFKKKLIGKPVQPDLDKPEYLTDSTSLKGNELSECIASNRESCISIPLGTSAYIVSITLGYIYLHNYVYS